MKVFSITNSIPKKIFFAFAFGLCTSLIFADAHQDLVLKASYAGLSYKKALLYAELSEKPTEELTVKEIKKLSALQAKIEKGESKMQVLQDLDAQKAEQKKQKIAENVQLLDEKYAAIDAYRDYVYHDEENSAIPINPKTGFPEILNTPFVVFDEGISFDMVTRLQKQEERSNFVWQDYLVGAYFDVSTVNMKPVNSMVRVAAYYPFYHTFDGMEVVAKQTVLYAFDIFAGPMLQADMWKYVYLKFATGIHYMYQLSDEWHLNYLGWGNVVGIELPVAHRWTIVNDGMFTLDYANLGTNNQMQPFDFSWSYSVSLGVRYSKKKLNKYAYVYKHDKTKKVENSPHYDSKE